MKYQQNRVIKKTNFNAAMESDEISLNGLNTLNLLKISGLLTHKKSDMVIKVDQLVKYAPYGNISIEGEPIEKVDSFCYLGSYIIGSSRADVDVVNRIQKDRLL